MGSITIIDDSTVYTPPPSASGGGSGGGVSNVIVDSGSIEVTNFSKYASHVAHEIEEVPPITYILKLGDIDDTWLLVKVDETDPEDVLITYASLVSNPTVTTSTAAWVDRTSLTYTTITEA